MTTSSKQKLGQFYTKKYEYVLQEFFIPDFVFTNEIVIIEPFAGEGHLIEYIKKQNDAAMIECFDIEPKKDFIIKRDTFSFPPEYGNKYIITNPPYLARNKSSDKEIFDKYGENDLYKCFLRELITNICLGGIIIIPLNFWSSIRANDIKLRAEFLQKYNIGRMNIFEEQVFDDTTYTVCSFQFILRTNNINTETTAVIYPSVHIITEILSVENNYMFGGEIYHLEVKTTYKIGRLTKKNTEIARKKGTATNILVKCIDDSETKQIGLSIAKNVEEIYIDMTPNQSARTYATLVIEPAIGDEKQNELVCEFNRYLQEKRKIYKSLFLTNYRESKDIARKRISFELVYSLCGFILENFHAPLVELPYPV